jgi:hypothetical protein
MFYCAYIKINMCIMITNHLKTGVFETPCISNIPQAIGNAQHSFASKVCCNETFIKIYADKSLSVMHFLFRMV